MNYETSNAPCRHTLTLVVAEQTAYGFTVRCPQCGEVEPERETAGVAFAALRQQRHFNEIVRPAPPSAAADLKETDRPLNVQVAQSSL